MSGVQSGTEVAHIRPERLLGRRVTAVRRGEVADVRPGRRPGRGAPRERQVTGVQSGGEVPDVRPERDAPQGRQVKGVQRGEEAADVWLKMESIAQAGPADVTVLMDIVIGVGEVQSRNLRGKRLRILKMSLIQPGGRNGTTEKYVETRVQEIAEVIAVKTLLDVKSGHLELRAQPEVRRPREDSERSRGSKRRRSRSKERKHRHGSSRSPSIDRSHTEERDSQSPKSKRVKAPEGET